MGGPNSTVDPLGPTVPWTLPPSYFDNCSDCLEHLPSKACRDCCEDSSKCRDCRYTDDMPPKLIDPEPDCHVECGTSPALRCKPRIFIILIACMYNLIN